MSITGLYTKNVPPLERALRVIGSLGVAVGALAYLHAPWSYVAAASSIGFLMTGLFGYCPACAMVGRRI